VPRYLVVANQTLGSRELWKEINRRLEKDPESYVYVVVPNTAAAHHHVVPAAGGIVPMPTVITGEIPETDEEATARARQLLNELLPRIGPEATAEGEVGTRTRWWQSKRCSQPASSTRFSCPHCPNAARGGAGSTAPHERSATSGCRSR